MSVKIFTGMGLFTEGKIDTSRTPQNDVQGHSDPGNIGDKIGSSNHANLLSQPGKAKVVEPPVLSLVSVPASYDTLFDDFDFQATPVYNFWTEDEETSDGQTRGDRPLDDIPRFVRLTWKVAPDLVSRLDRTPHGKMTRKIKDVKFALADATGLSTTMKGVSFSPEHLQPAGFSMVRRSLANGFVAPGTLNAVVEMSPSDIGSIDPQTRAVNEDDFLASPETRGISVHEMQTNIGESETHFPLGDVGSVSLGQGTSDTVTVRSSVGSRMSVVARTATPRPGSKKSSFLSKISDVVQSSETRSYVSKVNFVNPVLGSLVSEKRVSHATRPEHIENIVSVSRFLPNMELLQQSDIASRKPSENIPSFPSPPMTPDLQYVGYVIEKYRRSVSGAFELAEEIEVPDRETSEFVDCKVRYGEIYRYRIRAVIRWTRHMSIGPSGQNRNVITDHASSAGPMLSRSSSYFGGEWCKRWSYAVVVDMVPPPPPDELSVRPSSRDGFVTVTFRFPENSQKDIMSLVLYRKTQDRTGYDLSTWKEIETFGPNNVLYRDTDLVKNEDGKLDEDTRYVYAAASRSRHGEVSNLSEQIGVRMNNGYRLYGENDVDFVSCPGVSLDHVGSFSTDPPRRSRTELVFPVMTDESEELPKSGISLAGRVSVGKPNDDIQYVMRVKSLDTGEERDTVVNVVYNNQKELVKAVDSPVAFRRKTSLKKPSRSESFSVSGVRPKALSPFSSRTPPKKSS